MIQLLNNIWVQVGIIIILTVGSGILANRGYKWAKYLFWVMCVSLSLFVLYGIVWAWIINPIMGRK